jgi:hypothetical protein
VPGAHPQLAEETSPPSPLRGANIGFADIISGAERGNILPRTQNPIVECAAWSGDLDEAFSRWAALAH